MTNNGMSTENFSFSFCMLPTLILNIHWKYSCLCLEKYFYVFINITEVHANIMRDWKTLHVSPINFSKRISFGVKLF